MAMSTVSKELLRRDGGLKMRDESITAVALLAGNEASIRFMRRRLAANTYGIAPVW
jgi:hypothetical protein